ncbi:MAG: FMN-binding glutamate synthase family protein, partial [Pseudomonadales bacterium]|nr:FMN-binding glutamate synthase family protein [Pseudomonadales bacterium]
MDFNLNTLQHFALVFFEITAIVITLAICLLLLAVLYMYIADVTQSRHTIRRNYPVLGRFRYLFEHLGEFFRQYLFAQDREEMPFNRAQRAWVYRAAKNIDSTVAFGSTQPINRPGDFILLNGPFPPLEEEIKPRSAITFGAGYARQPYSTNAFFNISAMSFGA